MTDPLVDTPAFREAVEAMDSIDADMRSLPSNQKLLLAAAPHLERHFRRVLSEELRTEAKRCDPTNAYPRGPGRWLDAADHLEGK